MKLELEKHLGDITTPQSGDEVSPDIACKCENRKQKDLRMTPS